MKQPNAARIIEFPLKLTMANTCNIFAAFVVAFLTSLSLSSAFVNQGFDKPKDFQKNFDLELQPFLREKREEDAYLVKKHDPLELEELAESQTVYNRRAIAEEIKKLNHKDDRKNEETEMSNDNEEDITDDVFSYRSMHDLIQAFILADEQDIAMRLQQLREIKNATASETLSNLPKRQASASAAAAAAAASNLLGSNLWDAVPLTDLDAHSCEAEAVEYGHVHLSGLVVHEFFCELRKLWHYFLIIVRNLKAGLTLGPLIAEEIVASGHGILSILLHPLRLLHTLIREPHHLLILPDIIREAIPFPSITGAIHRFIRVTLKVVHFVYSLLRIFIRLVLGHFFHLHHHLGGHLRERLLELELTKLHHLYGLLPLGEEIIGGPVGSTAATAAATATATATATAAAADGGAIITPDYRSSLAEMLSSFRGIYDGYYASGIPHLIRTGVKSIATSSVYSEVISYLSNIPSYLTNIGSYLSSIPSPNYIGGYTPLGQGPVIGPAIASLAPIAPVETVSSSASASATVAETQPMISAAPLISAVPNIVSSVPVISSSDAASAAATATAVSATAAAAASVASASPVISSYRTAPRIYAPALSPSIVSTVVEETAVPCAPLIEPVSSGIVSETIENTVSESSSSSVAVASPEVAVPGISVENTVAAASASASASSASSDIGPAISTGPVPLSFPFSLTGYRSSPASVASSSSSASVSSGGNLIGSGRYRGFGFNLDDRIPLIRPAVLPAAFPSVASSSAAATAAATAGAATSSASAASSGGLNFILPREDIVGALGHDYLTQGDIISITLRNKAVLVGRVLDATSPINFTFLRPKLRASLLRHGGRVWNLSPLNFRDPECIRRLNSPLLLRYAV